MDFHGLKRKELQALCKEHGIPANLKNLEMADRLSSLLKEEKPKKRGRSCFKNLSVVDGDEGSKESKRVKFSPQNETFVFEKTDPRELRLLARKRGLRKPKIEENPVSVVGNVGELRNVDDVEKPVGRVLRGRSVVVKPDEVLGTRNVDIVENLCIERGNLERNLRSRGKKMVVEDMLLSPCVEKKAKRSRKSQGVVGRGAVEQVDMPPDKVVDFVRDKVVDKRRQLRSTKMVAEISKEGGDGVRNVGELRNADDVEKSVGRVLRGRSVVVKPDKVLDTGDVDVVEKLCTERGNLERNLRSRGKKMGVEDMLLSPCVEKKAKRSRKGQGVVGLGAVEQVDMPPDKVVDLVGDKVMDNRRQLRSTKMVAEISKEGDDGVGNPKMNNLVERGQARRSVRQVQKLETRGRKSALKEQKNDEVLDQVVEENVQERSPEMVDIKKGKRGRKTTATLKQQEVKGGGKVIILGLMKETGGRNVISESKGLKRRVLRKQNNNDDEDVGSKVVRRSSRQVGMSKVDSSASEQVLDDNKVHELVVQCVIGLEAIGCSTEKPGTVETEYVQDKETILDVSAPAGNLSDSRDHQVDEQCHAAVYTTYEEKKVENPKETTEYSPNISDTLHVMNSKMQLEDCHGETDTIDKALENAVAPVQTPLNNESSMLQNSGNNEVESYMQAKKIEETSSILNVVADKNSYEETGSTPPSNLKRQFSGVVELVCHSSVKPSMPGSSEVSAAGGEQLFSSLGELTGATIDSQTFESGEGLECYNQSRNEQFIEQENECEESSCPSNSSDNENAVDESIDGAAVIVKESDVQLTEQEEVAGLQISFDNIFKEAEHTVQEFPVDLEPERVAGTTEDLLALGGEVEKSLSDPTRDLNVMAAKDKDAEDIDDDFNLHGGNNITDIQIQDGEPVETPNLENATSSGDFKSISRNEQFIEQENDCEESPCPSDSSENENVVDELIDCAAVIVKESDVQLTEHEEVTGLQISFDNIKAEYTMPEFSVDMESERVAGTTEDLLDLGGEVENSLSDLTKDLDVMAAKDAEDTDDDVNLHGENNMIDLQIQDGEPAETPNLENVTSSGDFKSISMSEQYSEQEKECEESPCPSNLSENENAVDELIDCAAMIVKDSDVQLTDQEEVAGLQVCFNSIFKEVVQTRSEFSFDLEFESVGGTTEDMLAFGGEVENSVPDPIKDLDVMACKDKGAEDTDDNVNLHGENNMIDLQVRDGEPAETSNLENPTSSGDFKRISSYISESNLLNETVVPLSELELYLRDEETSADLKSNSCSVPVEPMENQIPKIFHAQNSSPFAAQEKTNPRLEFDSFTAQTSKSAGSVEKEVVIMAQETGYVEESDGVTIFGNESPESIVRNDLNDAPGQAFSRQTKSEGSVKKEFENITHLAGFVDGADGEGANSGEKENPKSNSEREFGEAVVRGLAVQSSLLIDVSQEGKSDGGNKIVSVCPMVAINPVDSVGNGKDPDSCSGHLESAQKSGSLKRNSSKFSPSDTASGLDNEGEPMLFMDIQGNKGRPSDKVEPDAVKCDALPSKLATPAKIISQGSASEMPDIPESTAATKEKELQGLTSSPFSVVNWNIDGSEGNYEEDIAVPRDNVHSAMVESHSFGDNEKRVSDIEKAIEFAPNEQFDSRMNASTGLGNEEQIDCHLDSVEEDACNSRNDNTTSSSPEYSGSLRSDIGEVFNVDTNIVHGKSINTEPELEFNAGKGNNCMSGQQIIDQEHVDDHMGPMHKDACMTEKDHIALEGSGNLESSPCGIFVVNSAPDNIVHRESRSAVYNDDTQEQDSTKDPDVVDALDDKGYSVEREAYSFTSTPPLIKETSLKSLILMHGILESTRSQRFVDVSGVHEMAEEVPTDHIIPLLNQEMDNGYCRGNLEPTFEDGKDDITHVWRASNPPSSISENKGESVSEADCAIQDIFALTNAMEEHGRVDTEHFSRPSEKGIERDGSDYDASDNKEGADSSLPYVSENFTVQPQEQNLTPLMPSYQQMDPTESACQSGTNTTALLETEVMKSTIESCLFTDTEIDLFWEEIENDEVKELQTEGSDVTFSVNDSEKAAVSTHQPAIGDDSEKAAVSTHHPAIGDDSEKDAVTTHQPAIGDDSEKDAVTTHQSAIGDDSDLGEQTLQEGNETEERGDSVDQVGDEQNCMNVNENETSLIRRNNTRSILIHGTPKKLPLFVHDMKENAAAPKRLQMVSATAVKPRRTALEDIGK